MSVSREWLLEPVCFPRFRVLLVCNLLSLQSLQQGLGTRWLLGKLNTDSVLCRDALEQQSMGMGRILP